MAAVSHRGAARYGTRSTFVGLAPSLLLAAGWVLLTRHTGATYHVAR